MRKKFTMLLTALLAFVGVAKAQYYVIESVEGNITDLSTLTEDSYVALYNVGQKKFIYEGGNHMLCMGTAAEAGAGHEYIWQVHKEGDTFLFTSASGRYFSTPLDGKDVYTVKSDNAAKDKFTITAHSEDNTKWLVKSSNANIYWDAQSARFVGWSGSGENSRYEIRPVTVSAAAENDFNKLITTSEDDIKWYTIKNVRKQKFATYAGDAATMTQQAAISGPSLFYFTGRATADDATVGIHNLFAGDNLCAEYNSWTATGREWLISKQSTGLSIAYPNNANNAWNDASGGGQKIEYWGANDPGSAWQIEIVTDFTEYLTAAKAAAILEIESLAGVSAVYANVAEQFKAEVEGVTANSAESLLAVNNILENYRKTIDGKSMKFRVDGRGSRFLGYSTSNNRIETQVLAFDDAYWTLKYVGNGYFKLYNPVHKVWLGAPDGAKKINDDESETSYTAGLANEADASLYKFEVTTGGTTVLLVAGNGNIAHAANDNHIMHYHVTGDQASWWALTDVCTFSMTYDEYKEFLTEKSTLMNQLMGYAKQLQDNSGLVKSGDKIAVVVNHPSGSDSQPSSNLLDGNNGTFVHSAYSGEDNTTHHYIEVELSEATQNIFCYFSKRNNSNRPAVIKVLAGNSADALNEVATLNLPESADDNVQAFFSGAIDLGAAYKYLRFVVTKTNTGSKYFTLSEFYVLPVNTTTEGIVALAGASIADTDLEDRLTAAKKSLKNLQLPETLAEVKATLDANVSNHEEEPQLGQYTTAAYNELKAAYEACTTIDQLDAVFAAFEEFKKAKNLPVFMISNGDVKDYAEGKSIYDDNSGTLHFKTTDLYDKTMWWALDQVETTVGVTGDNYVGIYNVGTGNGFLGATSIKVTETNENEGAGITDDNLFLIYRKGATHPAHFQESGSSIVEYWSYEATSGSAAMFTYIGNTYDLSKLTPEFVEALDGMKTSYEKKSALYNAIWEGTTTVTEGTGVGQYHSNYTDFAEAMTNAGFLLASELSEQLKNADVAKLQAIKNNIDAFALNMPVEGNYYRIKGANAEEQNYLTGNVTANGDRIALQADATDATIFQYVGGKLLAVESNLYVDLKNWTFQILASKAENTEFAASTRNFNAYTIKCGSFFHYNGDYLNRCGSDGADETAHDWLLEEVDAASVPANNNLLTDLANLYNASFRIYGERGFIYVAEDGNVKGTNSVAVAYSKNDKSHFAVVTIGENNYLYNVGAQKFVTKEGNIVALTDYPEHAFTIVAADNQSTDFDWTIKVNNKKMNLSNSGANGVYTEWETEDEGNRWALYKAGVFDKTEAEKVRKVTVNYTLGEKTITKNFGKKVGETFEIPSFDFATITSCKKGEEDVTANEGTYAVDIDGAMTINVAIEEHLPFVTVADAANITTWYYAQMHAHGSYGFYVSASDDNKMVWYGKLDADSAKYVAGETVPDSCLWGFAGNVVEGFKMISKADSKAVISTGSGEVAVGDLANATAFALTKSQAGGDWFCLKYPTNNNYLNLDVNKTIVNHWNANDNGSSFFLTEYNKEYTVTVNAEAGYSTYYSNYRLAIPETVEAYIIDNVNGKSINLTKVTGVLPANTGIILEGAGTHTFVTSAAETADVSRNLLKGTAVRTLITAEENTNYYVLAMPEGAEEAGLYKAALNKDADGDPVDEGGVAFHNGANKAYLPVVVEPAAEAPAMYSFTRGETTDIEGSELDAQGAMLIYDLTGRRVEKMEKGIYIVNGKKVLVK